MSAEILRKAASLMRENTEAAERGVWKSWGMEVVAVTSGTPNAHLATPVANCHTPSTAQRRLHTGNATHIASWHTGVALAVADLLDVWADNDLLGSPFTLPEEIACITDLARAYLGSAA